MDLGLIPHALSGQMNSQLRVLALAAGGSAAAAGTIAVGDILLQVIIPCAAV